MLKASEKTSHDLYGWIQMRAEDVYDFLKGYIHFLNALSSYKIYIIEGKSEPHYFWFSLNRNWLLDNYEPEEMFINGLI